jgi:hypothetical protein
MDRDTDTDMIMDIDMDIGNTRKFESSHLCEHSNSSRPKKN